MATVTTPYADSVETHPAVQRLIVVAQNYEWGRRASESEVTCQPCLLYYLCRPCVNLLCFTNSKSRLWSYSQVAQLMEAGGQPIDPNKPYAELW